MNRAVDAVGNARDAVVRRDRECDGAGACTKVVGERNGVETGVLRVTFNAAKEELMDTIDLPRGAEFQASAMPCMTTGLLVG